ncbi:MAG: glycosyltransferase [Planctomycetaceae bacterium]
MNRKHEKTFVKSAVMAVSEALLPTSLLTRVRFRLYGKWGDRLDGVESIRGTHGGRTPIPGLLRVLYTRSPRVEECHVHPTEDSVFDRPGSESIPRFMAGGRPRLATCSGVSWFSDRHLAVVNFHGRHARIYRVDGDLEGGRNLRMELVHHQDHPYAPPEDVAVTRDRRLLAVTHALPGDHMTTLHQLDAETLQPGPVKQRLRRGTAPHGVTFSPDSRFLFFTEVFTGAVQVYDVSSLPAKRTQTFVPPIAPRVPKSVAVTADCRFVAVAHAAEVALGREHLTGSRIAIHRFDADVGQIDDEPIVLREGMAKGLAGLESCAFLRGASGGPYLLAICDQAADLVGLFRFEPDGPRLEPVYMFSGVSFPHGLDGNPAGTLMAVACYGDDTLRLFRLPTDDQLSARDDRPHVLLCDGGPNGSADVAGAGISTSSFAAALGAQGYRVTCLVSAEEADEALASSSDRIVGLDVPDASPESPFDEHNAARLETLVREDAVDAVQVNGIAGMAALEAGRRVGVPTVLYLSGEDCELLSTKSDTLAAALLQALRSRADFQITESTTEVGDGCNTTLRLAATSPENAAASQALDSESAARLAAFYGKLLAKD